MGDALFLLDEKTGKPLTAGAVASRYVLNHNQGRDDTLFAAISRSVPRNLGFNETLLFLNTRYQEFSSSHDADGMNATKDALAFYVIRHKAQQALDKGAVEMPVQSVENAGREGLTFAQKLAAKHEADTHKKEQAEKLAERETNELARREKRTPLQAALEELVEPKYRDRVQAVLHPYKDLHPLAVRHRLEQAQEGAGLMGESWNKSMALEVFNRAQAIEAGAQPGVPKGGVRIAADNQSKSGSGPMAAHAAEIKPAAKPFKATLGIKDKDPLELAVQEMGAARDFSKVAYVDAAQNILNPWLEKGLSKESFLEGFAYLDGKAKNKEGAFGGKDYEMARNLLLRSYDIKRHQDKGEAVIARYANPAEMDAYFRTHVTNNRNFISNGGVPSATGAAADTVAVAPDTSAPAPAGAQALTPAQKKSIQFDMEALGYATGQPGGFDAAKGVDGMDGVFGQTTRPNLNKFLADHGLTELNAEAIEKLHTLAEAKRAQPAAQATAPAAQTAVPAPDATTKLQAALEGLKDKLADVSADPAKLAADVKPEDAKAFFISRFAKLGITATDADFTITDGIVSSKLFGKIEPLAGLAADEKYDNRLAVFLKSDDALAAAAEVMKNSTISGGVSVAGGDQAPSASPGADKPVQVAGK